MKEEHVRQILSAVGGGEIEYKDGQYHMLTEDGIYTVYDEHMEFSPYEDLDERELENIIKNLKSK